MSKVKEYYITEMERKFSGIPSDQNTICNICHKEYWKHVGCECPKDGQFEEPE
jgi:hypothetical protein